MKQKTDDLIIKDDQFYHSSLGIFMHRQGYKVTETQTAAAALEPITDLQPAIAIVGYQMEDMQIETFFRTTRSTSIPAALILITADSSPRTSHHARTLSPGFRFYKTDSSARSGIGMYKHTSQTRSKGLLK